MGQKIINVFVIIAVGVMLADLVHNANGTTALFNGLGGLWSTGVNGMLGSTSTANKAA
jgi:hypothetical protein